MTIALVIILLIGAVGFVRAAIVGESPIAWLSSLVRGSGGAAP